MRTACLLGAMVWAVGELAAADSAPTFSHDVWPILEKRCVTCHQAGAIAPMSFTSFGETRPWARAIREAVITRKMPPWPAAAGTTHPFRNDRSLSAAEIQTIRAWVDAGSPQGTPLPPFVASRTESVWKLGKPDVVIRIPGFAVPKTGQSPYSFLILPGLFARDTWVHAAEFRIDHRNVIHHINAFVRPPASSFLTGFPANQIFVPTVAQRGKRREGESFFDRRQLLLGYEPGYEPMPWLEDGGKLIPAGSDIVLEMHFTPNGQAVTDYSEIGLYYARGEPRKRVLSIDTLRDLDLVIPPLDRSYLSHASVTLAQPVGLLSIQPHMHLRGKSMEVRAAYPAGSPEVLLSVPHYDFNWQTTCVFQDPVALPAGTRIESVAGYDNSAQNPFNPDPSATVHWGDQTTEEMHIAFLDLVIDAKADPNKLIQSAPKMIGTQSSR